MIDKLYGFEHYVSRPVEELNIFLFVIKHDAAAVIVVKQQSL